MTHLDRLLVVGALVTAAVVPSAAVSAATVRLATLAPLTHVSAGATRSADCGRPDSPAAVTEPFAPTLPAIAAEQRVSGTAAIAVTLDRSGRVDSSTVLDSSGNRWIDDAALSAARLSHYSAETRACDAIGGSYMVLFDVADGR